MPGDFSQSLYLYLFSHISEMSNDISDRIHKKKTNLLTVMSFCLVGMLTVVAAEEASIASNRTASLLIGFSLILWLIAFLRALLSRKNSEGYHIIPGRDEGFWFLPSQQARIEFMKSDLPAADADTFFMGKILDEQLDNRQTRGHMTFDHETYRKLVERYNTLILNDASINSFNYNAWLASLSFMYQGQRKRFEEAGKLFRKMQLCFALCMALFLFESFCLIMKIDLISGIFDFVFRYAESLLSFILMLPALLETLFLFA